MKELVLSEKHHGIEVYDCWYADKPYEKAGIVRYKQALNPIGEGAEEFRTLLTDLTESEEAILEHISKNGRYEIRRAPKEGVHAKVYEGNALSEELLTSYFDFFEGFWESKGESYGEAQKAQHLAEAKHYLAAGAYAMTVAYVGDKPIIYHIYIVGEDFVRLYQSASQYRADETIPNNVVGFANRYLHYEDMKYFKAAGKSIYDWGGAGLAEDVASITKFKESFGGTELICYESTGVNGAKAKAYKAVTGIIGKLS